MNVLQTVIMTSRGAGVWWNESDENNVDLTTSQKHKDQVFSEEKISRPQTTDVNSRNVHIDSNSSANVLAVFHFIIKVVVVVVVIVVVR